MMHPEYISLRLSHEQPFLPYDSLCQMLWKRAFLHNLLFLLKEFQAPPLPLYNALLNQSVPALLPLMGHPHLVHKKNLRFLHYQKLRCRTSDINAKITSHNFSFLWLFPCNLFLFMLFFKGSLLFHRSKKWSGFLFIF